MTFNRLVAVVLGVVLTRPLVDFFTDLRAALVEFLMGAGLLGADPIRLQPLAIKAVMLATASQRGCRILIIDGPSF